jgi:hypothetical protein
MVIISGPRVDWAKMGTWKVIDNEPDPPTHKDFKAAKGWKMVTGLGVARGGGEYIIPTDQILLVCTHTHSQKFQSHCTITFLLCDIHVLIHYTFFP